MKKKHIDVIRYLNECDQIQNSKALASALSVSVRSIKNYIEEINLLSAQKLIHSTNNGYYIDKDAAKLILIQETEQLPQTSEERIHYIIKSLLIDHTLSLDIFDLCESIYISYSTLKNDISKMNQRFENMNITFVCEHDCIHIKGSEKNKRKLVSHIMYEETNSQFMDSSILKDCFKSLPIDTIGKHINEVFRNHNYYLNDFSYMNLLLHFAIIIDRIKVGNIVGEKTPQTYIQSPHESLLIQDLCSGFETMFHIHFSEAERFEIYMLFKTNANYTMPSNQKTLRKVVGDEILQLANHIVKQIGERYYVDLQHDSFMAPFSLHLKNLIIRAREARFTKNPMTQSIKNSCPTVYDMATFIAIEIMNQFQVRVIEDEVTFLALHIGAEIERQKSSEEKLKVILLSPDYREHAINLYNQLLYDFGNYIDIFKTVSYESEIDCHSDLIITTIPLEKTYRREVLLIPPMAIKLDRTHIYNVLDKLCKNKNFFILRRNFDTFFNKDLFFVEDKQEEKKDIIHKLCSKMIMLNHVKDDFEQKVMIREDAASTAFGSIAIPHSMDMDAYKTSITICIAEKGIKWNDQFVNIVILVAINRADNKIFHELYEALVEMFSDDLIIEQTKKCKSFEDFEDLINRNVKVITG